MAIIDLQIYIVKMVIDCSSNDNDGKNDESDDDDGGRQTERSWRRSFN